MHTDRTAAVAPLVAEKIERAQDMLGRLGRELEPNYVTEKLIDAVRCSVEALGLLGIADLAEIGELVQRAYDDGAYYGCKLADG